MNLFWLLAIYMIGAPTIGYFMFGKLGLRVWRDGGRSRILLFPITELFQTFSEKTRIRPFAITRFRVESALKNNDQIALFDYAMFQALFWPLRLMYTIMMFPIIFMVMLICLCVGFFIALLVWTIVLKQEEKMKRLES